MQKNIWQGIFWKVLSCGCFAGINLLVRYLSGGSPLPLSKPLPIYSIMFFQNIIGMVITSVLIWQNRNYRSLADLHSTRYWLHTLRVVTAAVGIWLWYISLRFIPATQVVALGLIAPIVTVLGAVIFLKENFSLQRKIAVSLSIFGGFLIARPDQALINYASYSWFMILPILAAFLFALDKLLTRKLLVQNETPVALTWYLQTFMVPLSLIPLLFQGWINPTLEHLPWLLLLGILGSAAHYAFNKAFALAEVTFLLPFGGTKVILSIVASYIIFQEIPRSLDVWMGVLVITLSTIVLGLKPGRFIRQPNYQY